MPAVMERRRPAVSSHPLAAVPAATAARVLPGHTLVRAPGAGVVHVAGFGPRPPLCRTRVRTLVSYEGEPLRLCCLCAAAVGFPSLVPGWRPTRAELAEVHLAAAARIQEELAGRLADVRSAAIADGSALIRVDEVPAWRREHNLPDDQPPAPLHAARIVGEFLTPATAAAAPAPNDRMTQRLVDGNARRRDDRIDARTHRAQQRDARPICSHCGRVVIVAVDHATTERVLLNVRPVHGGRVALHRAPGSEVLACVDYITQPAPAQPAHELHSRTCTNWPPAEPVDLDDDQREKSGGWRQ